MNIVNAITELARPVITYACGLGVATAVFLPHANTEVVAIAAGVATGVSYFRSQDKRAGVGTPPPA